MVAAALEALEDQLALGGGHAGSLVADLEHAPVGRPSAACTSIVEPRGGDAQGVVEQDPHDPRHRSRVGLRPAWAPVRSGTTTATSRSPARELELGGHRAAELAELHRLAAQLHLARRAG